MLPALAALLVCQTIGEIISYALHLPLPGPVIGMVLLFGWLRMDPARLDTIQGTAQGLLQHLSLLFVPAGVGIIAHASDASGQWPAILIAIVVSTAATIAVTALTARALIRRQLAREARETRQ